MDRQWKTNAILKAHLVSLLLRSAKMRSEATTNELVLSLSTSVSVLSLKCSFVCSEMVYLLGIKF